MTPPSTPSPEDLQQLISLIKEANSAGCTAASMSAERLRKCVDVGLHLIRIKATIPAGTWQRWADETLPNELSKSTRERWIRLAALHQAGKLDISSARGLRHAYELAELLPPPDPFQGSKGIQAASYLVHLSRLVSALNALDIATMGEEDKARLKARLLPLQDVITRL